MSVNAVLYFCGDTYFCVVLFSECGRLHPVLLPDKEEGALQATVPKAQLEEKTQGSSMSYYIPRQLLLTVFSCSLFHCHRVPKITAHPKVRFIFHPSIEIR